MFQRHSRHSFLAAAILTAGTLQAGAVRAEDIDLFRGNASGQGQPPNVLFLIDNTANWTSTLGASTKRSLEHEALSQLFDENAVVDIVGNVNVGFMVFSEEQPEGGKIIQAVQPLDDVYRETLEDYFRAGINDTKQGLQQANNASYALSMYEAYQYFSGGEPRSGGPGKKDNKIAQDPAAFDAGLYDSPGGDACYNYLVVIGNGQPDSGENRQGIPENLLRELGGNTDPIDLDPDDYEAIVADEFSRFFKAADVVPESIQEGKQTLRTYVIDVYDPDAKQNKKDRAGHQLLHSMAVEDSAYYEVTEPEGLLEAIADVLDNILAVNRVFAATALPVSLNVRGTNLNQVYIGVFRPNAEDKTRWYGNLKLYQLNASNNNLFLADANGTPAQNPENGFIRDNVTSFWTHDSSFWLFEPRGNPPTGSDAPDGAVVEKGGVAQLLRDLDNGDSYSPKRNVYTCTTGCTAGSALSGTPFDTGNSDVDAAALDVADAAAADNLIEWLRGEDNAADEDGDGRLDDVRASIHGDVLHSQPAIVNYGGVDADGNLTENVVTFYGANDGMFRAVQGGKDNGGNELWAFVPPEFFPRLKNLRSNTDGKTYFADGSATAYVTGNDNGIVENGERVYLYTTMRRGGRFLYAFDVTDPEAPTLLWRIGNDTPGFEELGQSWSSVRVGRVEGRSNPVAFFGAGYDPAAEDPDPDTGTDASGSASSGRGLFAVDAVTGNLIWQAGPGQAATRTIADMTYNMPAPPTPIDRDRDGFLDRVYIPDTGGQVWRANLIGGPATWEVNKLAEVGTDQEFQYAVDVVDGSGGNTELSGRYDAVLVGAGDREHPFDTAVTNRFYMFKDSQTQTAPADAPFTLAELFDATDNTIQVGNETQRSDAIATLRDDKKGWYMTLSGPGEKVVSGATTLAGTTFFNTNVPPGANGASNCNDLGEARNYAVSFRDATATLNQDGQSGLTTTDRYKTTRGGGFPPSPTPAIVELNEEQHLAVISGTTITNVPNIPLGVRQRVFWHRENLDQ